MFQYLLAQTVMARVPDARLTGHQLDEWGLCSPDDSAPDVPGALLRGHVVPVDLVVRSLRRGVAVRAVTPACRLEHLPSLDAARRAFETPAEINPPEFGDDHIVVNVRADEILRGKHPDYLPTPVGLVETVVRESGRRPVLVGQVADDPYSAALLDRLPEAEIVPSRSPMHDFATLRSAQHLLLAVSTFSWLAGWMSDAETIHLPVAGLFHPRQRPDLDLVPTDDNRYVFHEVRPRPYDGGPQAIAGLLAGDDHRRRSSAEIAAVRAEATSARRRRLWRNHAVFRARVAEYRWRQLRAKVKFGDVG